MSIETIKAFLAKVKTEVVLFFTEAKLRLLADSGPFWDKLKYLGGFLLTTGTGFQAAPHLASLGGYLIDAGVAIGAVSFLGAKTPPTQEQVKAAV